MIGIKITKPTYDVKTETDIKNKIFDSEKNVLGHRETVTINVTTGSNGIGTGTYTHNYGYVPIAIGYVDNYADTRLMIPQEIQTMWSFTENLEEVFQMDITSTTIVCKVYAHHYETTQGGADTNLANHTYTFTVVIFYNEMSETV